jgi:hypothetical protein
MNGGSGPRVRRRKPIVAALLSTIARGLGQVYNGQAGKALPYGPPDLVSFSRPAGRASSMILPGFV